jgi:hypothetical protein
LDAGQIFAGFDVVSTGYGGVGSKFDAGSHSDLPQSLSITAAQLLHNCCMSTCRSSSPLKKGVTACCMGAVDGATAAASMSGGAERQEKA